jgi:cyclopropane-fatty-acyl-phospholipid synthase
MFRIFLRNRKATEGLDGPFARLAGYGHRLFHWWHSNTPRGSRRNIGAHYDLGNDFFALWLDETMTYSSGIFPTPESTLREASLEKLDRVCQQLELGRGDHVLEIGTGWGSFALHAASHYGCHVTTTTISPRQAEVARQRIVAAGLEGKVTLLEKRLSRPPRAL